MAGVEQFTPANQSMKEYRVQLINRDLNSSCPPRIVQGYSGAKIGQSKYDPLYHCHSLMTPLTIEQYNKVADDLAKQWHRSMLRWQPRFFEIETPDTVFGVVDIPTALLLEPEPILIEPTQTITQSSQEVKEFEEPAKGSPTREELEAARFFTLVGIAKKAGVDVQQHQGKESIITAILAANG